MTDELFAKQRAICDRFSVPFVPTPPHLKVGVARNLRSGALPLNGVRHPPVGDTSGWYLWRGTELSADPEYFVPLHTEHLVEWCPDVLPYLGLPEGWRFLLTPEYEDVWFDPNVAEAP
jgi:hypothetical protein